MKRDTIEEHPREHPALVGRVLENSNSQFFPPAPVKKSATRNGTKNNQNLEK